MRAALYAATLAAVRAAALAAGLLAAMLSQYADEELGELAEDDARVRADGDDLVVLAWD